MAFDECIPNPSTREYVSNSVSRTTRWLERCIVEMDRLNKQEDTVNKNQLLFGINQGGVYEDIRIEHAKIISEFDLPGYAIGGLAVGESTEEMYETISIVEEHMPKNKPRYLMGVGTPTNIIEAVARGIDFFDCVMPARNGRHGHLYTWNGVMNIRNEKYSCDDAPIDQLCDCPVCKEYSRAYIRHLFVCGELLGLRLAVMHNLFFYNSLMMKIRESLDLGQYGKFRNEYSERLSKRI